MFDTTGTVQTPIGEQRTSALTPRGTAVVTLIRADWLRDVAPNDREPALYGICVAVGANTPTDRSFLADLLAAHQEA